VPLFKLVKSTALFSSFYRALKSNRNTDFHDIYENDVLSAQGGAFSLNR